MLAQLDAALADSPFFFPTGWSSGNSTTTCTASHPENCPKCKLISGLFAWFVTGLLAAICLAVLLYKRWRESPRRPWVVWFFDLSKQAFSSTLQHFANVFFGVILAEGGVASPCAWYFVLYVITSIAAVFIVALGMRVQLWLVRRYNWTLLRTGDYGTPPNWRPWLAQLLAWGFIGLSEKFISTPTLLIPPIHKSLGKLAAWLERPLLLYPHTELILVIVIAPICINVFVVVIFDNIMKRQKGSAGTGNSSSGRRDDGEMTPPLITAAGRALGESLMENSSIEERPVTLTPMRL